MLRRIGTPGKPLGFMSATFRRKLSTERRTNKENQYNMRSNTNRREVLLSVFGFRTFPVFFFPMFGFWVKDVSFCYWNFEFYAKNMPMVKFPGLESCIQVTNVRNKHAQFGCMNWSIRSETKSVVVPDNYLSPAGASETSLSLTEKVEVSVHISTWVRHKKNNPNAGRKSCLYGL